ncbi:MAG: F0F1 ATP synthase subunit A [Caulobacteraceae bacterium]
MTSEPTPPDNDLARSVGRRAARSAFWQAHGERSLARNLAMIGALGWLVVGPTLAGVFIGRWLDRRLHSGIFWSGALIMAGLALGCVLAWRRVPELQRGGSAMTPIETARLAAFALTGFALGAASFASLRLNTDLYLRGGLWRPIALHAARLAVLAGALVFAAPPGCGTAAGRRGRPRAGPPGRRPPLGEGAMIASPLTAAVLFRLGPVPITQPVVFTWGLMAVLTLGSLAMTRRLSVRPGRAQVVLELLVGAVQDQIRETLRADPRPYLPFLGTLFIFIASANLLSLIPGMEPPTAHIETDGALALIVFFAVHWFGVRSRGLGGYLADFRQADLDHAAAEPGVGGDPHLLADGPPVRQHHERGLHRRRRAVAGRPARADPVHGARPAHRPDPGLHLHRAGDGLHRRGGGGRSVLRSPS